MILKANNFARHFSEIVTIAFSGFFPDLKGWGGIQRCYDSRSFSLKPELGRF